VSVRVKRTSFILLALAEAHAWFA